jgi:hypothetical protein
MELRRKPPKLTTLFAALMIFGALLYFVPLQASGQGDSFTVAGSTFTTDEADLAKVSVNSFAIGLLDDQTGTINARYNIVAVKPLTALPTCTAYDVTVRFRDGDDTDLVEQVLFEIRRTSITGGGNDIRYTFNSNAHDFGAIGPTVNSVYRTVAESNKPLSFDFSTYAYWIELHITKGHLTPPGYAQLGSIQLRCSP